MDGLPLELTTSLYGTAKMDTPIITSIPPVFSRSDKAGNEIGKEYLEACIRSWRSYGFYPITVNSKSEELHPLTDQLGVEVVRVKDDASALTGRPHVFLKDIINAALDYGESSAFIINADIELEMSHTAQEQLHDLSKGQAYIAHRLDHGGDKSPLSPRYSSGIDLIGAQLHLLKDLNCGNLVFGMPWWDHYLPLMLLSLDAEFLAAPSVFPWHLYHEGRWQEGQHINFSREFSSLLKNAVPLEYNNPTFAQYLKQFKLALEGHSLGTRFQQLKLTLLTHAFPQSRARYLFLSRELSRLNESILKKITEDRKQ